jgi:hypothetical protein
VLVEVDTQEEMTRRQLREQVIKFLNGSDQKVPELGPRLEEQFVEGLFELCVTTKFLAAAYEAAMEQGVHLDAVRVVLQTKEVLALVHIVMSAAVQLKGRLLWDGSQQSS